MVGKEQNNLEKSIIKRKWVPTKRYPFFYFTHGVPGEINTLCSEKQLDTLIQEYLSLSLYWHIISAESYPFALTEWIFRIMMN